MSAESPAQPPHASHATQASRVPQRSLNISVPRIAIEGLHQVEIDVAALTSRLEEMQADQQRAWAQQNHTMQHILWLLADRQGTSPSQPSQAPAHLGHVTHLSHSHISSPSLDLQASVLMPHSGQAGPPHVRLGTSRDRANHPHPSDRDADVGRWGVVGVVGTHTSAHPSIPEEAQPRTQPRSAASSASVFASVRPHVSFSSRGFKPVIQNGGSGKLDPGGGSGGSGGGRSPRGTHTAFASPLARVAEREHEHQSPPVRRCEGRV